MKRLFRAWRLFRQCYNATWSQFHQVDNYERGWLWWWANWGTAERSREKEFYQTAYAHGYNVGCRTMLNMPKPDDAEEHPPTP